MAALANVGARTVGVDADEQGIVPEALEEELAPLRSGRRAGPRQGDLSGQLLRQPARASRRRWPGVQQLLEIARRWSRGGTIYVIEDAAYRELRYYGDDVPSMLALEEDDGEQR